MRSHPAKLLVLFPMYRPTGARRQPAGIDDALVVHRSADGRFHFATRNLTRLDRRSYARWLISFAADLTAGYVAVVVDRDDFIAETAKIAREHVVARDRMALDQAILAIRERMHHQIIDPVNGDGDRAHQFMRMIIVRRPRRSGGTEWQREGAASVDGLPVPRAEQLWRSFCSEWCDVRTTQHGLAAWKAWTRRNRPEMPISASDAPVPRDGRESSSGGQDG